MKNLILAISLLAFSCKSEKKIEFTKEKTENPDAPKIKFYEENFDFGEINEGEVVNHTYKFKNEGSMPLEVSSVDVSCGCTVAEKPSKPIGAGQDGEIKVSFNSAGKSGVNKKMVTVHSNAAVSPTIVSFDVIVNKQATQK